MFLARSVYEQYHLPSSINFTMNKIKPATIRVGTVKGTFERFITSDNAFSFKVQSEEHQHTANSFYTKLWLSSYGNQIFSEIVFC